MSVNDNGSLFLDEARELLGELEEDLLALESDPSNRDLVAKIFRAMHTIKGSGAMFGFDEVARFTHEVETVFDRVRSGEMALNEELCGLTLQAGDHISALLEKPPQGDAESKKASDTLMEAFRRATDKDRETAEPQDTAQPASEEKKPVQCTGTWWIRFTPDKNAFAGGTRPLALVCELLELGRYRFRFDPGRIPSLNEYEPEAVYGWWDVLLCTDKDENAIRDVFIFLDDEQAVEIRRIGARSVRSADLDIFMDFLTENLHQPMAVLGPELDALLVETVAPRKTDVDKTRDIPQQAQAQSIRVDSHRLDRLVNMVGELVIIQSRLSQTSHGRLNETVVAQISEDLERLTDEMRDNALGLRMLPIGTMTGGLRRLVRDLAVQLNKKVRLVVNGEDTELDKTVIDQLRDPLMHILRNSIDHAIEPPEERLAGGKDETGTITLQAEHASGEVLITVRDDGGGLDLDRIRERAVAGGLIDASADMDPKEIAKLVFLPGFSTAKQVSGVSGRGVGMDVVKRSIESLRGKVDLDTTPGKGTMLTIRLPLTLAIIDGMNVLVEGESFIVPLSTVEACDERFVRGSEVRTVDLITRRERLIPCVSLRRLLKVPGEQSEYERVVVCSSDNLEIGLAVDAVVGRQQAVIKPLSEYYQDIQWVSGTTINGDGGISLILDVPQLVAFARKAFASLVPPERGQEKSKHDLQ